MSEVFVYILAFIVTVPFLFLFLLYFITRKLYRNKRKAVHQTAQLMVPILITAVHTLLIVLFDLNALAWIIVSLLFLLSVAIIIQYKISEEILLFKAFKSFLRLSFLVFTTVYIGLTAFGIVDRLFL
ncbi:DUF3397 domain-containing protein [Halobacillus campisalis]|uniref:DUF3397 domain-containing protein n=1 Tax=Halobacillus campisalis TaxID=435909 RepID=A0ABW2K2F7_9BACI|nr:DUF3397 domain-containing protein [Halobacillus campisalis]